MEVLPDPFRVGYALCRDPKRPVFEYGFHNDMEDPVRDQLTPRVRVVCARFKVK